MNLIKGSQTCIKNHFYYKTCVTMTYFSFYSTMYMLYY